MISNNPHFRRSGFNPTSGMAAPAVGLNRDRRRGLHWLEIAYVLTLAACRAYGIDSENRPQRGQFVPDLQAHSIAMGQTAGAKWTVAVGL